MQIEKMERVREMQITREKAGVKRELPNRQRELFSLREWRERQTNAVSARERGRERGRQRGGECPFPHHYCPEKEVLCFFGENIKGSGKGRESREREKLVNAMFVSLTSTCTLHINELIRLSEMKMIFTYNNKFKIKNSIREG